MQPLRWEFPMEVGSYKEDRLKPPRYQQSTDSKKCLPTTILNVLNRM